MIHTYTLKELIPLILGENFTYLESPIYHALEIKNKENPKQKGLFIPHMTSLVLEEFLKSSNYTVQEVWDQLVLRAMFVPENVRLAKYIKDAVLNAQVRQDVFETLKEQADESKCQDASTECYLDPENKKIYSKCPHSSECLFTAVEGHKVKEFGITGDGEMVVNKKKVPKPGKGKARRERDKEEEKNSHLYPKPTPVETVQVYNEEYNCMETQIVNKEI